MPWFKVDDGFWSHPKVMLTGNRALGCWLRAGSWSAQHLTDGVITDRMLAMITPERAKQIEDAAGELVEVGLWIREGDEWHFHDWEHYQPERATVLAARAKDADRKKRGRDSPLRLADPSE